ncbi:MAG: matrixin family metalloprotease [Myxococcota bacterium]
MLRALSAVVASFFLLPLSVANAWCQSLSVVGGSSGCRQACLRLDDFTPAERESRNIVPLAWERPCIEYAIHEAGARDLPIADVERIIAGAFARWTSAECGGRTPGFMVRPSAAPGECSVPEYVPNGSNANTFTFVDDWSDRGLAGGAFALTTTWFSTRTGEIFDADMEINQEFWDWADCPEEGCSDGRIDLDNTVTHELGHFFGLAHTPDDPEATMWACADEGETKKRTLEVDDITGICTIYPPGAFAEECDFRPRGGFDPACRADRSGGCGCTTPGSAEGSWIWAFFVVGVALRRWRASRSTR